MHSHYALNSICLLNVITITHCIYKYKLNRIKTLKPVVRFMIQHFKLAVEIRVVYFLTS